MALWEGLYGERPFAGQTTAELFTRVAQGKVAEPKRSEVPTAVRAALERGLQPIPEDRWPDLVSPDAANTEPKQLSLFVPQGHLKLAANTGPALEHQLLDATPHRLSWMRLLARVFRIDVSVCQRCQGPMRVVRAVTCPDDIAAALHAARPPPRPSPPGQLALFVA